MPKYQMIVEGIGKLRRGNIHPDDPDLKYCAQCFEFKLKDVDFTGRHGKCRFCRAELAKKRYQDNELVQDYHKQYNKKRLRFIHRMTELRGNMTKLMDSNKNK